MPGDHRLRSGGRGQRIDMRTECGAVLPVARDSEGHVRRAADGNLAIDRDVEVSDTAVRLLLRLEPGDRQRLLVKAPLQAVEAGRYVVGRIEPEHPAAHFWKGKLYDLPIGRGDDLRVHDDVVDLDLQRLE